MSGVTVRTGCVRLFGLFMGFSAILRNTLVRCVLACTSPVAVRLQYIRGSRPVARLRLATFASAAVLPSYHTAMCKLDKVPPVWDVDFGQVPLCVRNLDRGFG